MSTKKEKKEDAKKVEVVWYKTWWGVLIVIFLILPFFLIWQVWAKTNWSKGAKIGTTIAIALFYILFWSGAGSDTDSKKTKTADSKTQITQTATPEPTPMSEEEKKKREEAEQARQKAADERKNFDDKKGNNAEAASTAEGMLTIMKDIGGVEGVDMYVRLDAPTSAEEDYKNGGDLGEYRKKVTSSNLMVVISSLTWTYTPESTQKDLVAGWVNALKTIYSESFPHVTVNNGTRTVAEGSWSVWNGEASVKLK